MDVDAWHRGGVAHAIERVVIRVVCNGMRSIVGDVVDASVVSRFVVVSGK